MQDILFIDTFGDSCNVTFLTGHSTDQPVERSDRNGRAHARLLAVFTDEIIHKAGCKPKGIAVIAGPGSYTGLRIGVSTAKGLAWSMDLPLYAISSLLYVAQQVVSDDDLVKKNGLTVFSVLHARKDEVFLAEFKIEKGTLVRSAEDQALSTEEASQRISMMTDEMIVVAPESDKSDEVDRLGAKVIRVQPSLFNLGPLLTNQLESYRVQHLHSFEPSYLKEFAARKAAKSVFEKLMF